MYKITSTNQYKKDLKRIASNPKKRFDIIACRNGFAFVYF